MKRPIAMFVMLALCGCTESLYQTETAPLSNDGSYVPVAPYFASVGNKISVAIVPNTPKDNTTPAGPPSVTVTLTPVPVQRVYLYFRKNSLFNNTFNVSAGNDGLLTSSDSSSQQQVTVILTELAQTAAAFAQPRAPGVPAPPPQAAATLPNDDPSYCAAGVAQLTRSIALYRTFSPNDIRPETAEYPMDQTVVAGTNSAKKTVSLLLRLDVPVGLSPMLAAATSHSGFVAFTPVPAAASIVCAVDDRVRLGLSQPVILYPYFDSRYVDPKRDFLTDPSETFTLNAGFLTGHKYADQSGAKTIVDTLTAPVRAIMPSVSVQQNIQVQTGGGKPDQTTTTTQTTTGPPKTQ